MELLTGMSRYVSVPIAAVAVSALVLRENFRRVEHVLLALERGLRRLLRLRHPRPPRLGRRGARARSSPTCRSPATALLVAVATVGTTLAPWGLAFIQSYAVDKRLQVEGPALRAGRRRSSAPC